MTYPRVFFDRGGAFDTRCPFRFGQADMTLVAFDGFDGDMPGGFECFDPALDGPHFHLIKIGKILVPGPAEPIQIAKSRDLAVQEFGIGGKRVIVTDTGRNDRIIAGLDVPGVIWGRISHTAHPPVVRWSLMTRRPYSAFLRPAVRLLVVFGTWVFGYRNNT